MPLDAYSKYADIFINLVWCNIYEAKYDALQPLNDLYDQEMIQCPSSECFDVNTEYVHRLK